jgi:protein involved in polysaccharide export with SLBB domain
LLRRKLFRIRQKFVYFALKSIKEAKLDYAEPCFRLVEALADVGLHLKNMQNLQAYSIIEVSQFYGKIVALVRQTVFFLSLIGSCFVASLVSAQVVAPSAPAGLPAGPSVPGSAVPGGTQPGPRSTTTPGQTTPTNPNGRTTTNGRTGPGTTATPTTTNGRTGPGATANTTTPTSQSADIVEDTKTTDEVIEDGYQAARRREKDQMRQKLFGYEIFNNPSYANTFAPNVNVPTPQNYQLGVGDVLNIVMYGNSAGEFSQPITPDGNIYFAGTTGIGPVSVVGLSIEQAKARITNRLASKFVGLSNSSYGPKNTYLEITLGGLRTIRVSVLGEAFKPGTYPMSSLSSALNAIYQAGGPDVLGSFRRINVIRAKKIIATLDLYDYLLTGIQKNDITLRDGDVIRIPTFVNRVEITGTVRRNNIFELLPGENLDRLLYYAGGFAANAYKSRIKVTRVNDRERVVEDVTKDQFANFEMKDGDEVTVEQLLNRFQNRVIISGAVYRPGQYSLDQNATLLTLIRTAENLREDAFIGRVQIIRTRDDLAIENITVNLADMMAGRAADVPLKREDQVVVSSRFDLVEPARISIEGEVNKPSDGVPYMANMTLEDLLLEAGGLKESAAAAQVEVVRRKRDIDPSAVNAQIAEITRFDIDRDLSVKNGNSRFVLQPFDQVIVRRSPNYRVQSYVEVEGEVILPGNYPIPRKDMKVSDLVAQSGGLTPFAYIEGATLIRSIKLSADEIAQRQRSVSELANDSQRGIVQVEEISAEKRESIGINMKRILENPGSSEDILIQEGDLLRIPKRLETVRIQGELLLPNTVKYRAGQSFQDYISQAGGFTSRSLRRKAFVVYANGSVDRTRKFGFFNIYPRVEPGSEIIIPRKTGPLLTPQQILASTAGTISSLLSVIGLILALSRIN